MQKRGIPGRCLKFRQTSLPTVSWLSNSSERRILYFYTHKHKFGKGIFSWPFNIFWSAAFHIDCTIVAKESSLLRRLAQGEKLALPPFMWLTMYPLVPTYFSNVYLVDQFSISFRNFDRRIYSCTTCNVQCVSTKDS